MCKDNNPDCNHVFQGNGAVNTIVRLPENVCFVVSNLSFIDLPTELTIWTFSVARCHLHAWLNTRFNLTWLLVVMARRVPSTN